MPELQHFHLQYILLEDKLSYWEKKKCPVPNASKSSLLATPLQTGLSIWGQMHFLERKNDQKRGSSLKMGTVFPGMALGSTLTYALQELEQELGRGRF